MALHDLQEWVVLRIAIPGDKPHQGAVKLPSGMVLQKESQMEMVTAVVHVQILHHEVPEGHILHHVLCLVKVVMEAHLNQYDVQDLQVETPWAVQVEIPHPSYVVDLDLDLDQLHNSLQPTDFVMPFLAQKAVVENRKVVGIC